MLRRYDVIVVGGSVPGHRLQRPRLQALSPMVGRGVAEWIVYGGPRAFDRTFFAAERFGSDTSISTSYRYKNLG